MAFTEEAVAADPSLVTAGQDRAWEVWDEPEPQDIGVVQAFRLVFSTAELGVQPDQRNGRRWKDTVFIEAAPLGSQKLTVVSLFIAEGDVNLRHPTEPSFQLASLDFGSSRRAHLIAHYEVVGDSLANLADARATVLAQSSKSGLAIPEDGFIYFFGHRTDGVRFIIGARSVQK